MKGKDLVREILSEPEIREQYEGMNSLDRFLYRTFIHILDVRRRIKDTQPTWYRIMYTHFSEL